jgi:hypothetical protein
MLLRYRLTWTPISRPSLRFNVYAVIPRVRSGDGIVTVVFKGALFLTACAERCPLFHEKSGRGERREKLKVGARTDIGGVLAPSFPGHRTNLSHYLFSTALASQRHP